MTSQSRALFISYDGLTDPLGGSQILPYLREIRRSGRRVAVLSFEKPARYAADGPALAASLRALDIEWHPLRFTTRPRYLAKGWDLARMLAKAVWLARRGVDVVHCRSYVSAQVGLVVKWLTGAQLLFDMRGFWPDERVDGGAWNRNRPIGAALYASYKRIERVLLRDSDHIVVLTDRARATLQVWRGPLLPPVTVIPCCADFEHFAPGTQKARETLRAALGIPEDAAVICYLGSLGSWYMLPQMFAFFAEAREVRPNSRLLLITKDWGEEYERLWAALGYADARSLLHIVAASREDVPNYLEAADLGISFIRPSFSKSASSPTKLAEMLAVGLPIVCNAGIGDIEAQMEILKCGYLLTAFDQESYREVVDRLDELIALRGEALRERARALLSLEVAATRYVGVYQQLEQQRR